AACPPPRRERRTSGSSGVLPARSIASLPGLVGSTKYQTAVAVGKHGDGSGEPAAQPSTGGVSTKGSVAIGIGRSSLPSVISSSLVICPSVRRWWPQLLWGRQRSANRCLCPAEAGCSVAALDIGGRSVGVPRARSARGALGSRGPVVGWAETARGARRFGGARGA